MNEPGQAVGLVDAQALRAALARWCDALEAAAPELNALDARLGDGDLGTTLGKCAENVRGVLAAPAADLQATLRQCAQACANASGSSFGTLLAVAFLNAAKAAGDLRRLDRDALATLLSSVVRSVSVRGGAALGDKTMLDSLDAIAAAVAGCDQPESPSALKSASLRAAAEALDAFRDRPNRIGRARMFADRSVGLDDPGMVAVQRMVQSL